MIARHRFNPIACFAVSDFLFCPSPYEKLSSAVGDQLLSRNPQLCVDQAVWARKWDAMADKLPTPLLINFDGVPDDVQDRTFDLPNRFMLQLTSHECPMAQPLQLSAYLSLTPFHPVNRPTRLIHDLGQFARAF
jgi:hypothetical protein